MMRSPLRCCTSIIRSSTLVQASSSLSMVRTRAWPRTSSSTKIYFRHGFRRLYLQAPFTMNTKNTSQYWLMIVSITWNSNLVPCLMVCVAQIHVDLSYWVLGFCRNPTGDLGTNLLALWPPELALHRLGYALMYIFTELYVFLNHFGFHSIQMTHRHLVQHIVFTV